MRPIIGRPSAADMAEIFAETGSLYGPMYEPFASAAIRKSISDELEVPEPEPPVSAPALDWDDCSPDKNREYADANEMTFDEIGLVIGVSGNRIQQIFNRAMRKLRHPSRSKELREYLP